VGKIFDHMMRYHKPKSVNGPADGERAKRNPSKGLSLVTLDNKREYHSEYARRWRETHPDKHSQNNKLWKQSNPDKVRAINHRRRARKHALPAQWTSEDWKKTLEHFGNRCAYCSEWEYNAADELHGDHLIPVDHNKLPEELKGAGGTVPWNMVPACKKHNISKHNNNPHTWRNEHTRWATILGIVAANPLRKYVELEEEW
jgi:hypothetical protein